MLLLLISPPIVTFINPKQFCCILSKCKNHTRDYKKLLFTRVVLVGFGLHLLTVHRRECAFFVGGGANVESQLSLNS